MVPDDQNDQAGAPTGGAPGTSVDERLARMTTRQAFLLLQLFGTGVASVCGVLVFMQLVRWQVLSPIAAVGGLIFALVIRRAFTWVMLYWLTTRGGPPA